MGMAFSLADLTAHVGADAWFAAWARAALGDVTTPAAAVTAAVLITVVVRFALPWQTAVPLLTVALTPFAQAAGLSPLIMALVALKAGNVFLLPQQSPYYLTLYYGTEERAFGHADARPFAWLYAGGRSGGVPAEPPLLARARAGHRLSPRPARRLDPEDPALADGGRGQGAPLEHRPSPDAIATAAASASTAWSEAAASPPVLRSKLDAAAAPAPAHGAGAPRGRS